jgi:hypothetical protein
MQGRFSESKVYPFWYQWFTKRWPPSNAVYCIENEMIQKQEINAYQKWVEDSLSFMLSKSDFFPYHPKTLTDKVHPPLSSRLRYPANIYYSNRVTQWICPEGWNRVKYHIQSVALHRMVDGTYDGRDQLWIENHTPFYNQLDRSGFPYDTQSGVMGVKTSLNVSPITKEKFIQDISHLWKILYPKPKVITKVLFNQPLMAIVNPNNQQIYDEWIDAWSKYVDKSYGSLKQNMFPYRPDHPELNTAIHPLIALGDGAERTTFYLQHRIRLPNAVDDPEALPEQVDPAFNLPMGIDYLYMVAFREEVGYSASLREKRYDFMIRYLVYYFGQFLKEEGILKFPDPLVTNRLKEDLPIFSGDGMFSNFSTPLYWTLDMICEEDPQKLDQRPGLFPGLPTPTAVTDPNALMPLPPSVSMECPDSIVLAYWRELIVEFRKKNPRLVLNKPSTEDVNNHFYHLERGYPTSAPMTDRIGFKSINFQGKITPLNQANDTTDLELVDKKFEGSMAFIRGYLSKNCSSFLLHTGAIIDVDKMLVDDDVKRKLKKWQQAIYQALHLRLAERHFFNPWEEWSNKPQEPSQFPKEAEIEACISEHDSFPKILDWKYMCWSENFYNEEQKKQGRPYGWEPGNYDTWSQFPKEIRPEKTEPKANLMFQVYWRDTLPFMKLKDLLKDMDQIKDRKNEFKIRELKPSLYQAFAQWIFHYQYGVITGYDPISHLVTKGYYQTVFKMDSFSNPNTWHDCIRYWMEQCYHELFNCPQPYLYQLTYPLIVPKHFQEAEPRAPLPGKPPGSGVMWPEYDPSKEWEQLEVVWINLKEQWMASAELLDYPTYVWDGHDYKIKVGSQQQIPSTFEKILNTIKEWFVSLPPTQDFTDPLGGGISEEADSIYGLFLPNSDSWCQKIKDMYRLIRRYPLPPLNQPPLLWSSGGYSWNQAVETQWVHYKEWIELNLELRYKHEANLEKWQKDKTKYEAEPVLCLPGQILTDNEGKQIMIQNTRGEMVPAKNFWVDMGVVDYSKGKFKKSWSWVFSPNQWSEALLGGDNKGGVIELFIGLLHLVKTMAFAVISTLGEILKRVLKELNDVVGIDWKWVGLGALGILGIWSYGQVKN